MATKAAIGDDVLKITVVVVGVFALYSVYVTYAGSRQVGTWAAESTENVGSWLDTEYNRAVGAPNWYWTEFWNQTTGQEGLGITNKPEGERGILQKDPDSWLWGYGPRKGWILG